MVERGRPEEHINTGKGKSLGLIEIRDSPIRWANIVRWKRGGGSPVEAETRYRNIYLVPDASMHTEEHQKIESVQVKGAPEYVEIYGFPKQGCWIILSNWYHFFPWATSSKLLRLLCSISGMPSELPLSRKDWDSYESIARYLLEHAGE